jgi:hypothetical protein
MRRIPWMLAAWAAVSGCSSLEVSVDYDPSVDFLKIHTWAWYPEPTPPAGPRSDHPDLSPLTIQRAQAAIEETLSRKGYRSAAPEQADVLVAVDSAIERRIEAAPVSMGWGWSWGHPYGWGATWDGWWGPPAVYTIDEVALIIDVLEPRPTPRLIWRGVARWPKHGDATPEDRQARIREAVDQALAKFPPQTASPAAGR